MQLYFRLLKVLLAPQFLFQRGNTLIRKTAGVNQGKIAQVCIYIQRKTVHRDIPATFYSDSTYLSGAAFHLRIYPDSGRTFQPLPFDPVKGQKADYNFFQGMDILFQPQLPVFQVKDRISCDLSGSVIRYIATPVRMKEGYSLALQQLHRDQ